MSADTTPAARPPMTAPASTNSTRTRATLVWAVSRRTPTRNIDASRLPKPPTTTPVSRRSPVRSSVIMSVSRRWKLVLRLRQDLVQRVHHGQPPAVLADHRVAQQSRADLHPGHGATAV